MSSTKALVLASNSPRRKQLLKDLGFSFTDKTHPVEENYPQEMNKREVAEYLAVKKNRVNRQFAPNEDTIITADTTVVLNEDLLEKPKDNQEARGMLERLSGKTHLVISGVCIANTEKEVSFSNSTAVTFSDLSAQDIAHYIEHFKPFDKAGAYGIQEWLGYIGIEKIEGSFYNVMGLPVHAVYSTLKEVFGFNPIAR